MAGAGLMGHGIAQVHAAIGLPVALYEPDLARAEAGRDRIAGNLDRAVAKGRLTAGRARRDARPDRRRPPTSPRVADADLVIEAVFEDLAVKTALWRELDALAPAARDLRLEHLVDRHPPAGRGGRAASVASGSSGCISSARCRSCRSIELIRGRDTGDETEATIRDLAATPRQAGHRVGRSARASSSTGS